MRKPIKTFFIVLFMVNAILNGMTYNWAAAVNASCCALSVLIWCDA